MIKDIEDLAEVIGCRSSRIEKTLLKSTTCGVSFSEDQRGVILSGNCEGADLGCRTYHLDYPFTEEEFWATLDKADEDGMDMWEASHGCGHCWPNGCMDDWDNLFDPGECGGPINPDCTHCNGEGIIL